MTFWKKQKTSEPKALKSLMANDLWLIAGMQDLEFSKGYSS